MVDPVYGRALSRAADILGDKNLLREELRVSMRELDAWLAGSEKPPINVFLWAIDIISAAPERAPSATNSTPVLAFLERKFESRELRTMVESALDAAIGATGADMGNVQLAYAEGLCIVAQRGFEQPFLDFFAVVDHDRPAVCGAAVAVGRRVVVPDVTSDPIFVGTAAEEVMARAGVRAVQSTPLFGRNGRLFGMISTHRAAPGAFSLRDLELIDRVARRTAFWLEGGA